MPVHLPTAQIVLPGYFRQAPLPSHFPSKPQVVAAVTAHPAFEAVVPAGSAAQVPCRPGTLQARHNPQALLAQHTPSTQFPPAHSAADVQVWPRALKLPHRPLPLQRLGGLQSALLAQRVRQARTEKSQVKGAQACGVPVGHAPPCPSQTADCVSVSVSVWQSAAAQDVPAWYWRHAPAPLHVPSCPQVLAAVTLHPPRASAVPAAMGAHVPREPAMLQARQALQVIDWQQTPSVQLALRQSEARLHALPSGSKPQVPPTHTFGAAQLASALHAARQVPELHV